MVLHQCTTQHCTPISTFTCVLSGRFLENHFLINLALGLESVQFTRQPVKRFYHLKDRVDVPQLIRGQ